MERTNRNALHFISSFNLSLGLWAHWKAFYCVKMKKGQEDQSIESPLHQLLMHEHDIFLFINLFVYLFIFLIWTQDSIEFIIRLFTLALKKLSSEILI